ncbi:S-methyl-5'-thioadenosine phosphorylase [Limnothrix sp. FACHB-1083]|uniref:S-methyl-5'-thioadenosine phosphorylase n=1 Tax=unclassified Limnothrix TaxID=2632864 RepID=UPI00167FEABD|nr:MULTISPECIES: S-methyl-5'-thioadenosine phosphorylase [unclassified Limnothrix]MBD2159771.1 S-methyl-5'-thioadenosine phosphorylase [Limnothrix sp. FACHB-1083]MBD2190474.1 S-methyl-5'-thioadenosine phosphorylase [Limnothrix sp. FACHB-1088]
MTDSTGDTITIGILGGSGLYRMEALQNPQEQRIETPFGPTSDAIITGTLDGVPVAFLARHGRHHHLLPTEVPYRANIWALKTLGVRYLLSVSAVGSLQMAAKPLDIVLPDQFIDRTRNRVSTFFGDGLVAHIAFGDPICAALSGLVAEAIDSLALSEVTLHRGGTYLCMEGPAFSTRAESQLYQSWGATVIGMTNLPEAKLAREAEIAYCTIALVTDYDCWHPGHDSVTTEMVIGNLHRNADNARSIIRETVRRLGAQPPESIAHQSLAGALLTPLDKVPTATLDRLAPLLAPYR